MSILADVRLHSELPDTPYNLWMRDELADILQLPHDGTRVEIIGGEIVVSPGPDYAHNAIIDYAHNAIIRGLYARILAAESADPSFPWRHITSQDVSLSEIHDGYIPDLCLLDKEKDRQAQAAQLKKVPPEYLELVLEVTSPSNAGDDRRPGLRRSTPSKWNGYARVGIPFYLLIDRDPKVARTTLFSDPDTVTGEYRQSVNWAFGEIIELPKPIGLEIPTDEWEPWQRG